MFWEVFTWLSSYIQYIYRGQHNETSAAIRWEAFKAYLRGQIISYTSLKTNKLKLELNLLEK